MKTNTQTIAGVVANSGDGFDNNKADFDLLLNALQTTGLTDALDNLDSDLTVFAPNDGAFVKLAQDLGFEGNNERLAFDAIVSALTELGEGDPIPLLTDILLYHVSAGRKTVQQLQQSESVSTLLDGATFNVNGNQLVDNEPNIEDPKFKRGQTDLKTVNGNIQVIDRVLIPLDIPGNESNETSTIAEIVATSGNSFDNNRSDFDLLFNALEATNLTDALADPATDLTVFAPNDRAFIRLAQDLGFKGQNEESAFQAIVSTLTELGAGDPIPLLTDILLYHVSAGEKTLDQLQETGNVETLLTGATFEVNGSKIQDNEPDILDPRFLPRLSDIVAANGTIQGINRVLIPLDIPGNERSLTDGGPGNDRLLGTVNNDTLKGNAGSDRLLGKQGDDRLIGATGKDQLRGGAGDDTLRGGSGQDTLLGGIGNDRLLGFSGRDLLVGGAGRDFLHGGDGNDTLEGRGSDTLMGGNGRDRILVSSRANSQSIVDGGKGNDNIILSGGEDTVILRKDAGIDRIRGFSFGKTTLGLSGGISFQDLSFQQGMGFSQIKLNGNILAKVTGISVSELNSSTNFQRL